MTDKTVDKDTAGWKDAPHIMCDIAGTIASAYTSGDFSTLRKIPIEGYEAFVRWLKRTL